MVMWVWLSYQINSCLQNFDIDIYRYCRLSIKLSVDSIYRPSLARSSFIKHTSCEGFYHTRKTSSDNSNLFNHRLHTQK